MTRNTKEVALIQHRTGKLSEMPKELHQSEIGVAYDTNRVFIGNSSNTILKNRTDFPYQNLEILTEFSELKNYFKYYYENNITDVNGQQDRLRYKEFLPIVVNCSEEIPDGGISPSAAGVLHINTDNEGEGIVINANDTLDTIIAKINKESGTTNTYATTFPGTKKLTLICVANDLVVTDSVGNALKNALGYPDEPEYDISMPIRKVTEKLDDNLNITDFGIKGDGLTKTASDKYVSQEIFSALVEVYKKGTDDNAQFYRNIFFPAGIYQYASIESSSMFVPFPLLSNMHIHGEGIDRTIINNSNAGNTFLTCYNEVLVCADDLADYYGAKPIENVLIEDMTFDSSATLYLAKLVSAKNVTFNRVKFVGDVTNGTLFEINGATSPDDDITARNITFNECIFENSKTAIVIKSFAENIIINNCVFNNVGSPAITVGGNYFGEEGTGTYIKPNDDGSVKNVSINGCQFIKTIRSANNSYVITLNNDAEYVSVYDCKFDDAIIEREAISNIIVAPYIDNGAPTAPYNSGEMCSENDIRSYKHKYYIATVDRPGDIHTNDWEEYRRHNYTDILDINTDELKLLRFKFNQPLWEYINYITNLNGEVAITVDGDEGVNGDITSANGLNIITTDTENLDIRSVKSGNVTLSMDAEKNLELGKPTKDIQWNDSVSYSVGDKIVYDGFIYECAIAHNPSEANPPAETFEEDNVDGNWTLLSRTEIIFDKILQLNDHMISNEGGTENIIIEPAANKIIEIKEAEGTSVPYEDKIVDKDNAIPNVAFVKRYAEDSFIKHITQEDLDTVDDMGKIEIGSFLKPSYGNDIHITGVTVNVRSPFYKVLDYMVVDSAQYKEDYSYYKGDVVHDNDDYGVILSSHVVQPNEAIIADIPGIMKTIPANTYTHEVKYVDVFGYSAEDSMDSSLIKSYNNLYTIYANEEDLSKDDIIDISKNNLFGYTEVAPLDLDKLYGEKVEMVSFQDRNYLLYKNVKDDETGDYKKRTVTATILHVKDPEDHVLSAGPKRMYDEGYIYKYDSDRNFSTDPHNVNPYTVNYAGGNVYIQLYTEDGTLITSANKDTVLLNPAGELVIRIDFVKEQL